MLAIPASNDLKIETNNSVAQVLTTGCHAHLHVLIMRGHSSHEKRYEP